ncbi:MAG: UvrD-helicase domain-containing protein, partial [Calditrichaeota bacterium]|nr:UvrD-helicase domain-containing protein [Calditrichota bacterium]
MNQNLNNQQLKAIDHNRNIVLNAGAGTGKTKVLVDRIVCLLEFIETLELKHIVAITFTVKAASELQDRLKDAFIEKIDVLRNEKTIAKFKRGLEQLTQANITTIHGFLNRCLRTYSVEADIDSLFRIINDFERIELKESAIIASLKNELMTNDAITSLYKIYGRFDFFRHMSEILEHPQLLENISSNSADELRGYWQTLRQSYIRDLLAKIRVDKQFAFILESVSKMRIGGNPSKDSFEFKQALQQVHLDLTDLGALLNLRESFMNKDASVSKNFLKKFDSNNHHMIGQLAQKVDFYCQQILPDFNQRDEDYFTIYPDLIAFAKTVAATQYDHKKEANVLDFNDLEIQTKRLLENSHHARSELRQNYRFFFFFEFQDTNQFQWQIINQLVSNDRQQLRPQKTFIVGDPK